MKLNKIYHGDCLEVLKTFPDNFVDCIVADPPYSLPAQYYASRDREWKKVYADTSILESFYHQCLLECKRVLKHNKGKRQGGNCFWFCHDRSYPILFRAGYEIFDYQRMLVWDKGRRHFSLGKGFVFRKRHELIIHFHDVSPFYNEGNRYDILESPVVPNKERLHPAQKPEKIVAELIEATCPNGGLVLDPFLGSGTTAKVARKLGRNWIGIELSKEYIKIAEKRLAQQTLGI